MSWYPVGPDLVISPKWYFEPWRRVSRRNEFGAQAAVFGIAVGASEGDLTIVTRRVGGSSVFRSQDDGRTWRCVSDDLNRAEPGAAFYCVLVRPGLPGVIFLGTSAGLRVSLDDGATWTVRSATPIGKIFILLADEATSGARWNTTVLYAGTDLGIARSADGGQTWQLDGIGRVYSLAAHLPATGARRFYAGVLGPGLMFSETVGSGTGAWRTLVGPGGEAGLPPGPASPGYVYAALVDIHARHPERVYALLVTLQTSSLIGAQVQGLYVSVSEETVSGRLERTWEERALAGPAGRPGRPAIDESLNGSSLFVAPEYSGPDTNDVILCTGPIYPWRASQGGRSWQYVSGSASISHTDTRSMAIFPPASAYRDGPPPGALHPRVYLGSDGGLAASRRLTDPGYDVTASRTSPARYNESGLVDDTNGAPESLNRGLASIAAYQLGRAGDPRDTSALALLGYISSLDTGTACLITSRAARIINAGDTGSIFIAQAAEGVRIWQNASLSAGWSMVFPYWNLITSLDQDSLSHTPASRVMASGQPTGATSNPWPDPPGAFFAGIITRESYCTITSPSAASPDGRSRIVTFTISAMAPGGAALARSDRVWIGSDIDTMEGGVVQSVGPDSFFTFSALAHSAGEPVFVCRYGVARVAGSIASLIGTSFPSSFMRVGRVARAGDFLYGATADLRLWRIGLSTATPVTPWEELPGRPIGLADLSFDNADSTYDFGGMAYSGLEHQSAIEPIIAALVVGADGAVYALLSGVATPSGGGAPSALWRIDGGAWAPENCTPPPEALTPSGGAGGAAAAHPDDPDRIYWSRGHRLYEVRRTGGAWFWIELSENLPGQEIHDLCIVNLSRTGEPPRYMLRALPALRGVWEREIVEPTRALHLFYFRKHVFDRGWTGLVADGLANPLRVGERVWHWQSPDIKIDAPERDDAGNLFYQTEPEAVQPKPGEFAWIRDRSDTAPAGQPLRVFVQVNNRGNARSGEVKVWAISCLWSGGLPELPRTEDGTTMIRGPFWSRFHPDGSLDVTIERGSPWIALSPRTAPAMDWFPVSDVSAESPAIAGFDLPVGAADDHRCIVAFVHGSDALLDGTGLSTSPDEAALTHPQVAQRNVSVGAPLGVTPGARGTVPVGDGSATGPGGTGAFEASRSIQFHNPGRQPTLATIRFDGTTLPANLRLAFRLSRNAKPSAVDGAEARPPPRPSLLATLLEWLRSLLNALLGLFGLRPAPPKNATRLPLSDLWFDAKPRGASSVRDVAIPAGGHVAAEIVVRPAGDLEPGSEHRLDILHLVAGKVIGGATLVLPVAGEAKTEPAPLVPDNEREIAGRLETRLDPGP